MHRVHFLLNKQPRINHVAESSLDGIHLIRTFEMFNLIQDLSVMTQVIALQSLIYPGGENSHS